MVSYFMPVFDGKNIVSCDNLRLEFKVKFDLVDSFHYSIQKLMDKYLLLSDYYECTRVWNYRHLFTFGFNGMKFVMGYQLNGAKADERLKGFIDFNPNKVLASVYLNQGIISAGFVGLDSIDECPFLDDEGYTSHQIVLDCFKDFYKLMLRFCKYIQIKRFDIAIDIPIVRDRVQLFKDKRKYGQFFNSRLDYTEYLGRGSHGGRVKVYNKTIESCLDYDLTRVEVTSDTLDYIEFMAYFPKIRVVDKRLDDINKVLYKALDMLPSFERTRLVSELSLNTRRKYESLLSDDYLDLTPCVFERVLHWMSYIVKNGI